MRQHNIMQQIHSSYVASFRRATRGLFVNYWHEISEFTFKSTKL